MPIINTESQVQPCVHYHQTDSRYCDQKSEIYAHNAYTVGTTNSRRGWWWIKEECWQWTIPPISFTATSEADEHLQLQVGLPEVLYKDLIPGNPRLYNFSCLVKHRHQCVVMTVFLLLFLLSSKFVYVAFCYRPVYHFFMHLTFHFASHCYKYMFLLTCYVTQLIWVAMLHCIISIYPPLFIFCVYFLSASPLISMVTGHFAWNHNDLQMNWWQ